MIKGNVKTQKHTSAGAVRFCVGCNTYGTYNNITNAIKGDVITYVGRNTINAIKGGVSNCIGRMIPTGHNKTNDREKLGNSVPNEYLVCSLKDERTLRDYHCALTFSKEDSHWNSEENKSHQTGTDPRVSKVMSWRISIQSGAGNTADAECLLADTNTRGVSTSYSLLVAMPTLDCCQGFKAEPEASVIHGAEQDHQNHPGLTRRSITPPMVESSRVLELEAHGEGFMRTIPNERRVRAPQPLAKTGHMGLTLCRSIGIRTKSFPNFFYA